MDSVQIIEKYLCERIEKYGGPEKLIQKKLRYCDGSKQKYYYKCVVEELKEITK